MKKIAVVGATGFATERMLPELMRSKICKVTAICARDATVLRRVAQRFSIPYIFTDLAEMLAADTYDAVYIATPPFLHKNNIKYVMETDTPILCEKPVVTTLKDARFIEKMMSKNKSAFMIGHHIRHQKAIKDLKRLVDKKVIGDIVYAQGQWRYSLDSTAHYATWKLKAELGGKSVMYDSGIHVVDIFYALFGIPNKVSLHGFSQLGSNVFDNETLVLQYKSMTGIINASQTIPSANNDLILYGTNGTIYIPEAFSQTFIKQIRITKTNGKMKIINYKPTLLYKNEMESLVSGKTIGVPGTTLAEAIYQMEMLG